MNDEELKNEETVEEINDVSFEDLDEAGDEKTLKEKLKNLSKKLKEKEKEAQDNLTGWQRARAELVNKEKTLMSERLEIIKQANAKLVEEILPTFDNFEMAKRNKEIWEKVDSNWRVGIEYIFQNLKNTLVSEGLEEIFPKGNEDFNVETMEAVEEVSGTDENDHKVAECIQTGYKLNGKLLRPAKVKIFIKR